MSREPMGWSFKSSRWRLAAIVKAEGQQSPNCQGAPELFLTVPNQISKFQNSVVRPCKIRRDSYLFDGSLGKKSSRRGGHWQFAF